MAGKRTPPFPYDPVVEEYKKDIDRTLIRENLKLTPAQRMENLVALQRFALEFREAAQASRRKRTK